VPGFGSRNSGVHSDDSNGGAEYGIDEELMMRAEFEQGEDDRWLRELEEQLVQDCSRPWLPTANTSLLSVHLANLKLSVRRTKSISLQSRLLKVPLTGNGQLRRSNLRISDDYRSESSRDDEEDDLAAMMSSPQQLVESSVDYWKERNFSTTGVLIRLRLPRLSDPSPSRLRIGKSRHMFEQLTTQIIAGRNPDRVNPLMGITGSGRRVSVPNATITGSGRL
jgi:hypothetical protein